MVLASWPLQSLSCCGGVAQTVTPTPQRRQANFVFVGIGLGREQSSDQEDGSAPRNQVKDHDLITRKIKSQQDHN
jgi:hypothetical protein